MSRTVCQMAVGCVSSVYVCCG